MNQLPDNTPPEIQAIIFVVDWLIKVVGYLTKLNTEDSFKALNIMYNKIDDELIAIDTRILEEPKRLQMVLNSELYLALKPYCDKIILNVCDKYNPNLKSHVVNILTKYGNKT